MNRQEAIDRLKNEVKCIEEIMENGDYGCVDMDTWDEFAKKAEWRETLIELLTGPTPDPDTGLVPCGCRSKRICVAEEKNPFGKDRGWVAYCENCFVGTLPSGTKEAAVQIWNTAMGGRA